MLKTVLLYVLTVVLFGFLIGKIIEKGERLPYRANSALVGKLSAPTNSTENQARDRPSAQGTFSFGHLLLQLLVVLIASRAAGRIAALFRQPAVIGEMIVGICLGPSVLGYCWPLACQWIFPAEYRGFLSFLSQLGLLFFMFIVGMETQNPQLKKKVHHVILISHSSIALPFFLGVGVAYLIFGRYDHGSSNFLSFALFMGIAMSITAFPVLARIVQDNGMAATRLGNLALICAATDDITSWCLLAIVVAFSKSTAPTAAVLSMALSSGFIATMLLLVKPPLQRKLNKLYIAGETRRCVAVILALVIVSSWITDAIGIHALFGAFLAGMIMPADGSLKRLLSERVDGINMLLMPIFFVNTGLFMRIDLIGQQHLWPIFFLVLITAIGGKFLGSALAARASGQTWHDSLTIGALMNTRGLMELVVLNIGYGLGIISPAIFAVMVIMAIITTVMVGPLLLLIRNIGATKPLVDHEILRQ